MITQLGDYPTGATVYVPFHTFDSNDPSASVTITGLAVTDIEIYKDGSVTQRSSDSGYSLLDTDGIDFDGTTGLHGFSIDLSDDTDSGFFAAGSQYWIAVSSITVDAATINFWAGIFTIAKTGGTATVLTDTEAILTDSEAVLTDSEAVLTDSEAIIADTESSQTSETAILADTEASQTAETSILADTEAVLTDSEAVLSDTEASQTSESTIITDTEAILTDSEAILADTEVVNAAAVTIVTGAAATGTLSTTQMSTNLSEATDDHYIGRTVIWTSGVLTDQASDITDYAGTNGVLTFTAVTEAPSNGDTFVIV